MNSTAAGTTHAVRLRAGMGQVTVAGLGQSERDTVRAAWSRCSPEDVEVSASEADVVRGTASWEADHESLVYSATSAAIAAGRGSRLMLHAACLADPATGAAVAMAAASGTGKTTATRRLGPHFAYLTDETAIIDPTSLAVTPFPKPLSLLGASGRRPKTQAGPDELGLGDTIEGARLARVAVLDRVRGTEEAVAAQAERMPLVDALCELVPHTSSLSHLPRGLVTLCSVIDRLGGVQRLVYAEADDLRPVLEGLLAAEPEVRAPEWEALEAVELAASAGAGRPEEGVLGRVRRVGATDGIVTDAGALVLLHDNDLAVLEGLGPALWLLLQAPRDVDELLTALAEQGSPPADARERVVSAIADLESHGLVRRGGAS